MARVNISFLVAIIVLTAVFLLMIFFVPMPYSITEVNVVKEPYDAVEMYIEQEPHEYVQTVVDTESSEECKSLGEYDREVYWIENGSLGQRWDYGTEFSPIDVSLVRLYSDKIEYKIFNNEEKPGDFKIIIEIWDWPEYYEKKLIKKVTTTYTIPANSFVDAYTNYSWVLSKVPDYKVKDISFSAYLVPPENKVCTTSTSDKSREVPEMKYREVEKTRHITRYKDVQKEVEVTKYVTLYNQWADNVES